MQEQFAEIFRQRRWDLHPHEHLYAVPPTCQKDRDLEVSDYEGSVADIKAV